MSFDQTLTLNNDVTNLLIGFGTKILCEDEGVETIQTTLAAGCRLIDTTQSYHNEDVIGRAVAESDVPRQDDLNEDCRIITPEKGPAGW